MHESRTGWTFKKPTENGWYWYREGMGFSYECTTTLFYVQFVPNYGFLFAMGGLLHPVRALNGRWQPVTIDDRDETNR